MRVIAQYFYPQRQTQVMNEGCATFVHYTIMNTLFDRGMISEGAMLEILQNHSNVVFQPAFDDPRYSGINPYALGLDMMQDIQRISTEPTAEDRDWFPDIRRQWQLARDPARCLGQSSRRILHPPISEPGTDPEMAALRAGRRGEGTSP